MIADADTYIDLILQGCKVVAAAMAAQLDLYKTYYPDPNPKPKPDPNPDANPKPKPDPIL